MVRFFEARFSYVDPTVDTVDFFNCTSNESWLDSFELDSENIIFKCECLFDMEISKHIKSFLSVERLIIFFEEGLARDDSWSPPLEFSEPFKKYLKIKNNFFISINPQS